MNLNLDKKSFIVFDLDDTLYPEIQFLESGFKFIAGKILPFTSVNIYGEMIQRYKQNQNVFEWIVSSFSTPNNGLSISYLLHLYREHIPNINLNEGTKEILNRLKEHNILSGLITDGRSSTQRNKIKALGLTDYFSDIIISEEFGSEKPDQRNYLYFENKYRGRNFYYIGDNTLKDFIVPQKLGWVSICLKHSDRNIHPQNLSNFQSSNILESFNDLNIYFIERLSEENTKDATKRD